MARLIIVVLLVLATIVTINASGRNGCYWDGKGPFCNGKCKDNYNEVVKGRFPSDWDPKHKGKVCGNFGSGCSAGGNKKCCCPKAI